jgi:hypothetical protein
VREERRLRVFENRVLRGKFGCKRDEVIGEWRKLHNEEIHDPYTSPIIVLVIKSRRMILAGYVAWMGEGIVVDRVLVGNIGGQGPLGRSSLRWADKIQMDRQGVGCGVWTGLMWLRIETGEGTCVCGNGPSGSIKCGEFLD